MKNQRKALLLLLAGALCFFTLCGCTANSAGLVGEADVIAGDVEDGEEANTQSCPGTFSTRFNEKNRNRAHNIRLAAESISGVILFPNQEFSYNETLGPTTRENGYRLATVFFNKEKTEGYGGGICQVSTTLYNAAEDAGMEITERHHHSLDVAYVEKGRDATTSQKGNLDLKFVNPFNYNVVIHAEAVNGVLTVTLEEAR